MRTDIVGHLAPCEGDWLYEQAKQANVIVEVGCYKGRSTEYLCCGCPGVVYTIDNFIGSKFEDQQHHFQAADLNRFDFLHNMKRWLDSGKLFLLEEDTSSAYKILEKVLRHRKADMIFIDGEHDEQSVRFDIRCCYELLAPGGLLCGHDFSVYNHIGVVHAVTNLCPKYQMGPNSIWYVRKESNAS